MDVGLTIFSRGRLVFYTIVTTLLYVTTIRQMTTCLRRGTIQTLTCFFILRCLFSWYCRVIATFISTKRHAGRGSFGKVTYGTVKDTTDLCYHAITNESEKESGNQKIYYGVIPVKALNFSLLGPFPSPYLLIRHLRISYDAICPVFFSRRPFRYVGNLLTWSCGVTSEVLPCRRITGFAGI